MGLLDLTGPQTVYYSASKALETRGRRGYVRHTASLEGGLIHTAEGTTLHTESLADLEELELDTLVVPGSPDVEALLEGLDSLIAWIAAASRVAKRTVSVCSGAFLLAQAGLLDGKRAATHWAMADRFGARFADVELDRDAIFVQQDKVWTSAGVSAGLDLALALIEAEDGHDIAIEVARELVLFLKRPGGQSQFSELLESQAHDTSTFDELHVWLASRLRRSDLSVEQLAKRVHMSPRNFARVYKQKTGRTPAKTIELFRLEAAKRLLETSSRNIEAIARSCGFGDEERMRATFRRHLAISPKDYRKRFSS